MPRKSVPKTAAREFVTLLWWNAVLAIPFALFFGVLNNARTPGDFLGAYLLSAIFTYAIGLALWVVQFGVVPRLAPFSSLTGSRRIWFPAALYGGTSIIAALTAAIIIHFTLVPGFLGNARSVIQILMFSIMFAALGMGISFAVMFHRNSMARAREDQELTLARRIQRSFLLSQFPEMPRLEVHALNVSSREVSGDFYDVVPAGEDAFLLAIADVAGKGVPAALLSSMLQASLRTQANSGTTVSTILRNINSLVYRSTSVHQFATFFLARVEESRMRLSFSNAGHNFPILFRRDGTRVTLERGGTVVGILEGAEFEEDSVALEPGDRVVLYTDGISEAEREDGEMYGEERLIETVNGMSADLSAREATERILESVRGFLDGVDAGDDMTLMVLRVLEPASRAGANSGAASAALPAPSARPRP